MCLGKSGYFWQKFMKLTIAKFTRVKWNLLLITFINWVMLQFKISDESVDQSTWSTEYLLMNQWISYCLNTLYFYKQYVFVQLILLILNVFLSSWDVAHLSKFCVRLYQMNVLLTLKIVLLVVISCRLFIEANFSYFHLDIVASQKN